MPTNVEIKARVRDPGRLETLAAAMSDTPARVLVQRDTFFRCTHGRLKLRELGDGPSELIWYERSDTAGSRRSDYVVAPITDAAGLRAALAEACGVTREVAKTRRLFLVGQTRIHLDAVEGLGDFVELEVVLGDGQSEAEGHAIAGDLMRRLGIEERDLLDRAYADMLPEAS